MKVEHLITEEIHSIFDRYFHFDERDVTDPDDPVMLHFNEANWQGAWLSFVPKYRKELDDYFESQETFSDSFIGILLFDKGVKANLEVFELDRPPVGMLYFVEQSNRTADLVKKIYSYIKLHNYSDIILPVVI